MQVTYFFTRNPRCLDDATLGFIQAVTLYGVYVGIGKTPAGQMFVSFGADFVNTDALLQLVGDGGNFGLRRLTPDELAATRFPDHVGGE